MRIDHKPENDEPEFRVATNPSLEHIPLGPSDFSSRSNPPQAPPPKGSRKLVTWLVVLSVLWLIVLIAGTIFIIDNRKQEQKQETTESLSALFEKHSV